jgi:A/G-specific adenine glycosylase
VSASGFAPRIVAWQRAHGRHDLPWQNTRDPYRIWVSEIMLQQTQVATALPYYLRFIARFPDVAALAAAPIDDVLVHWSGLGYYRRAHHLHAAAQAVTARYGGVFPRDAATLATLPGVGRSTAAAIAVFGFGARAAILDGNVKRVLARHRGVDGFPGAPKVAARLWALAESLLPQRDVEPYTQGLMDLGAAVCTRGAPRCDACPVARDCVARREGRSAELPSPRPRKTLPRRARRVLLIECRGEILLEKRPPVGIWGGLWSLPECALEEDVAAVVQTRFGVAGTLGEALPPIAHGFTHFALTLHPRRVTVSRGPACAQAPGIMWTAPAAAERVGLPAPIRKLLARVSVLSRPLSRQ